MRIEIIEPTGIKHAPYGHMLQGEVREVDEQFGRFACANGWAKDVAGQVPTGQRGSQDYQDPAKWEPGKSASKAAEPKIQPADVKLK